MPNTLTDAPIASHTLAQDQPLIESNNLYYGNTLNVDHQIGPANGTRNDGISGEGYHKVVHYVTQLANPAPVANTGQLYTKLYTPAFSGASADTQLFFETALGGVAQMTGAIGLANGGWCWSSGLLFIWGKQSFTPVGGVASGTVTFTSASPTTIPFPTACFNVQLTLNSSSFSNGATMSVIGNPTTTSFNWGFSGTASSTSFFWLAIGN